MDPENKTNEGQISTNEAPQEKSFLGIIVHSFFIVPFLIAVFCVLLFASIHMLTREQQTVYDFINDVKTGGSTKRWQAAFELSRVLANPDLVPDDAKFSAEMISAYKSASHDDARVQQYLALAMGRTGKKEFFEPLSNSLTGSSEDNLYAIVYALGMLRDTRAVSSLATYVNHQNPRIRSAVIVSLGNIGAPEAKKILKNALNDQEANVKWGAAISLAQMNDDSGLRVLEKLLDRDYLSSFPEVDPQEQNHLILAAIEAAALLKTPQLDAQIYDLAERDQNMKVRAAAKQYLEKKSL